MDIINDLHFQDFIISRDLRESSVKEYARTLDQYCSFLNKNPTELIEEAEVEEENQVCNEKSDIKFY
jgi:hypothetical protein